MTSNAADSWDDLRSRVLDRDGHCCWNCNDGDEDTQLHAHHINPDGGDRMENLVTLCAACHRELHELGDFDKYPPDLLESTGLGEGAAAEMEPRELLRLEPNSNGQIYLGRDLAGKTVKVAYEIVDEED